MRGRRRRTRCPHVQDRHPVADRRIAEAPPRRQAVQFGLEQEAPGLRLGPTEDGRGVFEGVTTGASTMRTMTTRVIVHGGIGHEDLLMVRAIQ